MRRMIIRALLCTFSVCAFAATYTNSFVRDGATYVQRGGLTLKDYVITNLTSEGGGALSTNGPDGASIAWSEDGRLVVDLPSGPSFSVYSEGNQLLSVGVGGIYANSGIISFVGPSSGFTFNDSPVETADSIQAYDYIDTLTVVQMIQDATNNISISGAAMLGQDAYFSNLTVRASEHTYSISVGRTNSVDAQALGSLAAGYYNVKASKNASVALGNHAQSTNETAFVWSGVADIPYYGSHGPGSFNINPSNGTEGVWIGGKRLPDVVAGVVTNRENLGFTPWKYSPPGDYDLVWEYDIAEEKYNWIDIVSGAVAYPSDINATTVSFLAGSDNITATREAITRNSLGIAFTNDLPQNVPVTRIILQDMMDGTPYSLCISNKTIIVDEVK